METVEIVAVRARPATRTACSVHLKNSFAAALRLALDRAGGATPTWELEAIAARLGVTVADLHVQQVTPARRLAQVLRRWPIASAPANLEAGEDTVAIPVGRRDRITDVELFDLETGDHRLLLGIGGHRRGPVALLARLARRGYAARVAALQDIAVAQEVPA